MGITRRTTSRQFGKPSHLGDAIGRRDPLCDRDTVTRVRFPPIRTGQFEYTTTSNDTDTMRWALNGVLPPKTSSPPRPSGLRSGVLMFGSSWLRLQLDIPPYVAGLRRRREGTGRGSPIALLNRAGSRRCAAGCTTAIHLPQFVRRGSPARFRCALPHGSPLNPGSRASRLTVSRDEGLYRVQSWRQPSGTLR